MLPVDRAVALEAAMLPEHHCDPADRIIIASALIYQASLMSLDLVFPLYQELKGVLERWFCGVAPGPGYLFRDNTTRKVSLRWLLS
ncbi:hypothetical protein D3C84_678400 [compost metagenome]